MSQNLTADQHLAEAAKLELSLQKEKNKGVFGRAAKLLFGSKDIAEDILDHYNSASTQFADESKYKQAGDALRDCARVWATLVEPPNHWEASGLYKSAATLYKSSDQPALAILALRDYLHAIGEHVIQGKRTAVDFVGQKARANADIAAICSDIPDLWILAYFALLKSQENHKLTDMPSRAQESSFEAGVVALKIAMRENEEADRAPTDKRSTPSISPEIADQLKLASLRLPKPAYVLAFDHFFSLFAEKTSKEMYGRSRYCAWACVSSLASCSLVEAEGFINQIDDAAPDEGPQSGPVTYSSVQLTIQWARLFLETAKHDPSGLDELMGERSLPPSIRTDEPLTRMVVVIFPAYKADPYTID